MVRDAYDRSHFRSLLGILSNPFVVAGFGLFWLAISATSQGMRRDEGLWGYQGWLWVRHHLAPYAGSVENKTPGIFYVYALSDWLFGHQIWFPRVLGVAAQLATSFLLYWIGRRWRDRWCGLLALTFFLLASAWSSFDGPYPAQTESFVNLFVVAAIALIWQARTEGLESPWPWWGAGVCLGMAISFKQIALTSLGGAAAFLFWSPNAPALSRRQSVRLLVWMAGGAVAATALSLVPLLASGASLRDYVDGAWRVLLMRGDLGAFPGSSASLSLRLSNLGVALKRPDTLILALGLAYLVTFRGRLEKQGIPAVALGVWLLCDVAGVHASGYGFLHQFKQMLPSLSLAVAVAVRDLIGRCSFRSAAWEGGSLAAAVWLLALAMVSTDMMPSLQDSVALQTHAVPAPELRLGQWLQAHSNPSDYIFAVDLFAPQETNNLLFYAERRSSSRYFNGHFVDARAIPEVQRDLSAGRAPRFIILWDNEPPLWLAPLLETNYRLRLIEARFWIFENSQMPPVGRMTSL